MLKKLTALALLASLLACTFASARYGKGFTFIDTHPFRDSASIEYIADGDRIEARLNHMVRPEGESATQETVRHGFYWAGIAAMLLGGVTGNLPVLGGGAAVTEAAR